MSVLISDDILQAAQISETELKREIAILLFQKKKLGLNEAQELAETSMVEFQQELENRGIPTVSISVAAVPISTEEAPLESFSRPLRGLPLQISSDFDAPMPDLWDALAE
jgi:predicted HTH domain antitoxin